MSEIEKYKKYLRFKANPRYLRRDFIVPLYTGTEPDIVPETSVEQQGAVQEFNDGGRVERQGFAKGSVPPGYITGKELEELTGIPNLSVKAKELMYAPKEYKRQKNLFGDFYKKQLKAKYFDIGQGGKYGTLHYKKPTAEQIETMKEYHLRRGAKYGVSKATADRMKLFHNDPKLRNYVRNGKLIPDELLKEYGVTRNEAAQSTFRLAQAYNGKKFVNVDVGIPKNRSAGKKLFEEIDKAPFGNPYKMAQYKEALNTITEGIGDKYFETTTFENMKREARRILQKEKIEVFDPTIKGSKGINVNELTGVTASSRNKSFPYSQFINLMEGNLNTKAYAGFNKQFEKYEKDLQNEIAKGNKGNPNKIIKEYKNYTKDFLGGLEDVDKAQIEKLGLPELSLKDPTELYGKKRTSQLLSQGLDLPGSYKELGYSIKVPKGTATLKEFINNPDVRNKAIQMIGDLACGARAKAMNGGRINFSEGSDCFNKGLKILEEGNLNKQQLTLAEKAIASADEAAPVLKNILSKAGSGIKFTGRGVTELLSIGAGPLGLVAGAALETGFALPYLAEGDYKQALRQSIFGQVPQLLGFDVGSRSEDVLKVAKEAGANPDLVKKYVELEKNMREQDEIIKKLNVLDELRPRYANNPGGAADIDLQIKRLENKLKPSEEYLTKNVYSPKEFNQITDEYLKAGKYFVNKNYERTLPIFDKSEEAIKKSQSELFKESITPIVGEDQSEKLLKQKGVLYEKPIETETIPEELPSEYKVSAAEGGYIDYIRDYNKYARGGRIHLSEGGKGPKLSRRGFLGFLMGAASLPFVGKLMKGKKGIQAAKVATKVLPKVSGMPEWFPSLVARIEKEGIDISPKATRVEDIRTVKKIEVPVAGEKKPDIITMTQYPDGTIHIEADVYGGSFDSPFDLHYKPPKSDVDLETGKAINYPGEFSVMESRPRPVYDPHSADWELEYENMSVKDAVSDLERVEKIATGKRIHPKRVQQREKARVNVEENPYDDIINRYGEVDTPDWWDPND
jgi:hypothetical protein